MTDGVTSQKNVLLLVIDGMSWSVVKDAMAQGQLPFLSGLAERGVLQPCVSIFPSITPAATAAIITGKSSLKTGIQGANWHDEATGDNQYFGDDLPVILREGIGKYVKDYLHQLNDSLLKAPTLFEKVHKAGKKSAGINFMWRRGNTKHVVNTSLLMNLLPSINPDMELNGPDWVFMGEFFNSDLPDIEPVDVTGGLSGRFGFNDDGTLKQLEAIAKSSADPALTVAYFPENDFVSHDVGAENALETLIKVDEGLMKIAHRVGGIDHWLQQTSIIVVGDHGHSNLVKEESKLAIPLEELLSDWKLVLSGSEWSAEDELMVCPNMRAAQINLRQPNLAVLEKVTNALLKSESVDQVIVKQLDSWFRVSTSDRGVLEFRAASADEPADTFGEKTMLANDQHGNSWFLRGELSALDIEKNEQDCLVDGEYPNAMERIAKGSTAIQSSIWATSKPGHEFTLPSIKAHVASSHGSLHRSDSETLLITAGLPSQVKLPAHASITDIAPICLDCLGINNQESSSTSS